MISFILLIQQLVSQQIMSKYSYGFSKYFGKKLYWPVIFSIQWCSLRIFIALIGVVQSMAVR